MKTRYQIRTAMLLVQLLILKMTYAQSNPKQNHVTVVIINDHVSSLTDTAYISYQPNITERSLEHKLNYTHGNPAIFTFRLSGDIGRVKVLVNGERRKSLPATYVEKGDSVLIKIDGTGKETTAQFIGNNGNKFRLKGILDSIELRSGFLLDSAKMRNPDYIRNLHNFSKSIWEKELHNINVIAPQLTKKLRDFYKADIDGEFIGNTSGYSYTLLAEQNFNRELFPVMQELLKLPIDTGLDMLGQYSWKYMQAYQNHIKLRFAVDSGRAPNMLELYDALKTQVPRKWRDPVIHYFLKSVPKGNPADLETCLKDAITTVDDISYKKTFVQFLNARSKGQPAYNFSLINPKEKMVNMSNFKDKIVLLDFWFTGCPGCLNLSKILDKQVLPQFNKNKNFIYVTINIDKDKKMWQNSIASGKYTKPEYVNLNTNGQGNDSPLIDHYKISSYPTLILIDRSGKIINANINSFDTLELIRQLNAALLNK